MSSLPGYRFYPTEDELITFYLGNKLQGRKEEELNCVIPVVDIYSGLDPWHLPKLAGEKCKEDEEQWFFFGPQQEREASGGRPNRITPSGYWKATGSPCFVYSSHNQVIGVKKTMVFYQGRAPAGKKTKWKVNEYRAIAERATPGERPMLRSEFSVCRVYAKSGCLRSFDRRPSPAEPTNSTTQVNVIMPTSSQVHVSGSSYSSTANVSTVERAGLHDSSSSGEHHAHHQPIADGIVDDWSIESMDYLLQSFPGDYKILSD